MIRAETARSKSLTYRNSWDVLVGYCRRGADDGFVYLYGICKGSNRHIILFDCAYGHYGHSSNGDRVYSIVDSCAYHSEPISLLMDPSYYLEQGRTNLS